MSAPQRVNVMLSRARNALIVIGNPDTFVQSRKGKDVWIPLMDKLKLDGHVYNGFPVKCEQHPDKTALLTKKEQFDSVCPDGGCSEPWYVILPLNKHWLTLSAEKCLIAKYTHVLTVVINCKITQRCSAWRLCHRPARTITKSLENVTTKLQLCAENAKLLYELKRSDVNVTIS